MSHIDNHMVANKMVEVALQYCSEYVDAVEEFKQEGASRRDRGRYYGWIRKECIGV